MASLYAGTSGFAYPAWKPEFYPADVAASRFLEHYAGRLNCVEINYTFRRTPQRSTLEAWAQGTPPGFVFAVKAHQRITHVARLLDAGEATAYFLTRSSRCARPASSGRSSFSCRPTCTSTLPRLAAFLELLPAGLRATIEFRHDSWFTDEVFDLLRRHGVALCVAETEKLTVPEVVTAGFVYERLRKPAYSDAELAASPRDSRRLLADGLDVYLVFKHDETPSGALEAEWLLQGGLRARAKRGGPPPRGPIGARAVTPRGEGLARARVRRPARA